MNWLEQALLISTPLQRGGKWHSDLVNRFNGFPRDVETVKTVFSRAPASTPLKRGVNDIRPASQGRSMKYPGSTGVLNKTTVECEFKAGKIVKLKVTPESRRKDVELGL